MQTAELLRKVRRLEIRSRHLVEDLFAGQSESIFKGRGVEFEEVRPYLPGDEVRDIDWNVTARLGEPFRKKFIEEREVSLLLLFEDSVSLQFGSGALSGTPLSIDRVVNAAANARCAGIGSKDGDPPTTTPLAAGITVGSLNSATFETTLPAIPCRAALYRSRKRFIGDTAAPR